MALAQRLSQRSWDACGGTSNLDSAMWSTSHGLLTGRPQKLNFHSRRFFLSMARISSPGRFQPFSNNPSSPCQVVREKTCLEFISPSLTTYRIAQRWVCAGGGKRPRRPHIYKTRHKRGSFSKADQLLQCLEPLSNVKEEVYGALDAFIAWELDFPLVPVKKALYVLEGQKKWTRIIQVVKWMLGKGQGRSLSTYHLLLRAFSEEGRIDEAQELYKKVFSRNLECTPIKMCVEIMRMYNRYEMYEDLLEVFADMEELNMNLNLELTNTVSGTYQKLGFMDKAEKVLQKYGTPKFRYRRIKGRTVKYRKSDIFRELSTRPSVDHMETANQSKDAYGNVVVTDQDGEVEEEDWRDHRTEDDEEFHTEGDEEGFQMETNEEEFEADGGHFHSSQFVGNEVYMQL